MVLTNLLKLQAVTTKHYNCKLAHINARSITNKSGPIQHYLHDQEVDICAITETWVKTDDQTAPKEILPPGYNIITKPRPDGRCGGGLAIVYKSLISITETECEVVQGTVLEALKIKVKQQNGRSLNLYVIYQYPNTSMLEFAGILSDTLEQNILADRGDLILIGNFNVHKDNPTDNDIILFNDFLDSFNLINKIDFEMHQNHHTLNLIITSYNYDSITNVSQGHYLSDHCFIHATLQLEINHPDLHQMICQKLKSINQEKISSDLGSVTLEGQDMAVLVSEYNTKLWNILDTHVPLKERAITKCHSQPWFDDQVKIEIRLRRMKEQRWKSEPNEYNYIAFYKQQRYITGLIKSKKKSFYVTKIQQNANNPKEISNITNKLLGRNDQLPLTAYEDKRDLANDFSSFSSTK